MGNTFKDRLEINYNNLKWTYHALYNKYGATNKNFARLICILKEKYDLRADKLKEKDLYTTNHFIKKNRVGMTFNTVSCPNIEESIESLKDLGITYVHLNKEATIQDIQLFLEANLEVSVTYDVSKIERASENQEGLKNPQLFEQTVTDLLELANQDISVISLDVTQLNQSDYQAEDVHEILHMLHMIKDIVCPSVAFLGKGTHQMHEAVQYFGREGRIECELMPHVNYMSSIWNSLATRDTRVMRQEVSRYTLPTQTAWLQFAALDQANQFMLSEDAVWSTGSNPQDHQQFLVDFYSGSFEGSFSNATYVNQTISGTVGDLVGIDANRKDTDALKRDALVHGLVITATGTPLLQIGDEMALLKDSSKIINIYDAKSVYESIKQLIEIRQTESVFERDAIQDILMLTNTNVYGVKKTVNQESMWLLFNVSERVQTINCKELDLPGTYRIVLNNEESSVEDQSITLNPYGMLFIATQINE